MITVLIADDQELVRTGFRLILAQETDIEVIADAANGQHAVQLTARLDPDVILMDIRMPIMDGLAATRALHGSRSRVLILTTFDSDEYVYQALESGASGFLLKDAPADQLIAAIRVVAAGDGMLDPAVTRRLIDQFARRRPDSGDLKKLDRLTTRERQVLRQMADGRNNTEIAHALVLSEATVKTHVARIIQKLEARDRVQAVITAHRSGLAYD